MKKLLSWLIGISPFKISMVVALATIALYVSAVFGRYITFPELIEYRILDSRFKIRGAQPEIAKESPVTVIAIDEKTLQEIGRWPFSRSYQADLVKALREYGSRVIAFDIVFSEADQNSELTKVREIQQLTNELKLDTKTSRSTEAKLQEQIKRTRQREEELQNQLQKLHKKMRSADGKKFAGSLLQSTRKLESELKELQQNMLALAAQQKSISKLSTFLAEAEQKADNDAYFAEVLRKKEDVVLGYFIDSESTQHAHLQQADFDVRTKLIEDSAVKTLKDERDDQSTPLMLDNFGTRFKYPVVNIPQISEAAWMDGHFVQIQDQDGAIRWYPTVVQLEDKFYPSLGIMAVSLYAEADPVLQFDGQGDVYKLIIDDYVVPLAADGRALLNYRGPTGTYNMVSFIDVIKKRVDPKLLEDKIALIGPTAVGIYDLRNTPFDPALPGVEIHATAIDNAIRGDYLRKPFMIRLLDVAIILALGVIMGVLANLPSLFSGLIILLITGTYLWLSQWAMDVHGIWLTTTYQLVQIIGGFLLIIIFKYMSEEKKRKQIKGAFQYYLNPEVVDEVIKDPDKLKLGGEKKNLTMLFSDVRGFTTISEALDAEELSHLLNIYLTPMTNIVFDYSGTLDKYIGDALMAVFGAPIGYKDGGHAWRGCHVALEMMDKLAEMSPEWIAQGYPEIDIGIGLNSGEVSVGNMGSDQRFDYTVMGDAVNLAARLEGINKSYKTNIVISEFTVAQAGDKIVVRELDAVKVKGKLLPVTIFELVAKEETPEIKAYIERWNVGLAQYRNRDFDEAIKTFESVIAMRGSDGPSEVFIERCVSLKSNMPPEGWDGVYTMTTK